MERLERILKEHKEELKARYKIREIGIFGSFVRGEQKGGSDLDILIEFEEKARVSLLDFVELEDYMSNLLGIKVDLVEKEALKPRIGRQILKEVIFL